MEVVGSFIDYVFRPLKDFFAKTFGYVMACGDYVEAMGNELNELKSQRDDVKRRVDAAERQGMEPTSQVKWWLKRVKDLEETAARIEVEFQERLRAPPQEAPGMRVTYHMSKKADETLMEACNLKEKGEFPKVADDLVQVRVEEMPSVPVVGMNSLLEQLHQFLGNKNVGVIGIYGMAGVGKTALLNKFNNDYLIASVDIGLALYIDVTRDFDLNNMQKIIGDRLGVSWGENKTPKKRAAVLYKALSKINFVIILDDLWEPLNLSMIGIPVPKQGSKSKIILTTRIEDICDRMDVTKKIKVDCLQWEDAWKLFQEKVGETLVDCTLEISRHAKEVAQKCGGLPLSLITIGRAMASKRTVNEWKHAITILRYAPWQLLGMETDVLLHLKQSYDNLLNDNLRTCLLYCSLFPENFSIYKEWIIGYCIGEGFIDDLYTEMDEIYNKGFDILGDLKRASLLETGDDDDHVKMHPMVRAMALWIASDFGKRETQWLVRAGVSLKEAPGAEKWSEAERVSLMKNNIIELFEKPHCPRLKTLMLQSNARLEKICDGFFQYMPLLRVLDLSHTSITELPSGIGALVGLQYLDMYNTNVKSLPRELGSLVNLRFLLLSSVPLETIPSGVICNLTMLQILYMDDSYCDWKVGDSGKGVEFKELENLRRLKALDITIQTVEALEKLAGSYRLARSTRNLLVKGCQNLSTIRLPSSDLWKNMTGLKRVWIMNCSNLGDLVIDDNATNHQGIVQPSFQSAMLHVHEGHADEHLILPALQNVMLQNLQRAKIVYKNGCIQNLTSLYIIYCIGMEKLIEVDGGDLNESDGDSESSRRTMNPFPALKEMLLYRLPKIRSLSDQRILLEFPSLKTLKIRECPLLKKLNLAADELREIQCTTEWWNALQWEDESQKNGFGALVKPLG